MQQKSLMRVRETGFSLIELVIVVGIVGLLASVAIPAYTDYIDQARRTDGTGGVLDCATRLERNFTVNNTYTTANVCVPQSPEGHYTIAVVPTATTYTITATAVGTQARDTQCTTISINQIGVQTALDDGGNATTNICWRN